MAGKTRGRPRSAAGKGADWALCRLEGACEVGEIPRFVAPELATLVDQAPGGADWLHEVKFDGYRTLARIDDGLVTLYSRNGKDWTGQFPELATELALLPVKSAMLDGEVVAQLADGTTSFEALRRVAGGRRRPGGAREWATGTDAAPGDVSGDVSGDVPAAGAPSAATLRYYAFDLLYLDGWALLDVAVEKRRELLSMVLSSAAGLRRVAFSQEVPGDGRTVLEQACRLGLEGVVSKKAGSRYAAGARGADWLKAKCRNEQEFVIGGYTEPSGSRVGFGALLLGVYEDGGLRYSGKVGTGFDESLLRSLGTRLKDLEISEPAFTAGLPKSRQGMHWVKPELVAQVGFMEWTSAGSLRHPSFKGLRTDKTPREVRAETVTDLPEEIPAIAAAKATDAVPAIAPSRKPGPPHTRRSGGAAAQAMPVATAVHGVTLSHPDKVFWPRDHITKRDLADYYDLVAPHMLPYVLDRPVSMVRCPEGLGELPAAARAGRARIDSCFFHKHPADDFPGPVGRIAIVESGGPAPYLTITEAESLTALAQMGVLEIHVWGSTWPDIEHPDMLVFDLDPDPGLPWQALVEGARLVRGTLHSLDLESFVKTTGGKGLHVIAPVRPGPDWEQVRLLCRQVADAVVRQAPDGFTANMAKAKRAGKIFVDYVRNNRGATSIAPYSTRAREGATVAVPLRWDELDGAIRPDTFTVKDLADRLGQLDADPWEGYFEVQRSQPLDLDLRERLESL